MEWISPEIFIAIFGSGGIIVTLLQIFGVIKLPKRRVWPEQKKVDNMEQRTQCKDAFQDIFTRINSLEDGKMENKTLIKVHSKALEIVAEKLDNMIVSNAEIKTAVHYLAKMEKKRNGDEDI